jgi:hypothetical protein
VTSKPSFSRRFATVLSPPENMSAVKSAPCWCRCATPAMAFESYRLPSATMKPEGRHPRRWADGVVGHPAMALRCPVALPVTSQWAEPHTGLPLRVRSDRVRP